MQTFPKIYQEKLSKYFKLTQYLVLSILWDLIQNRRQIKLEKLAQEFPLPISTASRIRKLQRFLSLPQINLENLWFPLIFGWIEENYSAGEVISIALDRTQWRTINLFVVSVIVDKRAIPLYFYLLDKERGNSNLVEQQRLLSPVLPKLRNYKVIVLGDREFCGVEFSQWLTQQQVYFCLRLKKDAYIELEADIWFQLEELGLEPGTSVYYPQIKYTKGKGFGQSSGYGKVNLVAKFKGNYRHRSAQEPWFILTNLDSFSEAIEAYKKRMGIEEMFRDYKLGGYQIEGTQVKAERLIALIWIATLAYAQATFIGKRIKQKGISKYIVRPQESTRRARRNSTFRVGSEAMFWVQSLAKYQDQMKQLIALSPNRRRYYNKGLRAAKLAASCL